MIIDSHQHFWDPARGDYGWLEEGTELCRLFGPDQLAPMLQREGIDRTILVQAAPTVAETNYLLEIARATDWVAGVVGWVALDTASAVPDIEQYAHEALIVGIRPMLQDIRDEAWILSDEVAPALRAVADAGLVFDALIRSPQLRVVAELAARYPRLEIVIDHAAKPPFADPGRMGEWATDLRRAAEHENIYCKLSGLLTELPAGASEEAIIETVDFLLDLFGPDRLMWGSDWPVLTTCATYDSWLCFCRSQLRRKSPSSCEAVMGTNAARIYGLAEAEAE